MLITYQGVVTGNVGTREMYGMKERLYIYNGISGDSVVYLRFFLPI